jgi:hypothetical protein
MPFVNNYGVWVDEFNALGLSHTLEKQYPDAECFFGEGKAVSRQGGVIGSKRGRFAWCHVVTPVALGLSHTLMLIASVGRARR